MRTVVAVVASLAAMLSPAAANAAWFKGFVVDYYTMPGWWGGATDVNCPNGDLPPPDYAALLKTPWRSEEEVHKMTSNGALGFETPLHNRGPKPGQNVHRDPTLVPDPMMPIVVGHTGYGFDLDGDPSTGFVSPDGKARGLDNQAYRAVGCHEAFRGGGRHSGRVRGGEAYDTGEMRGGAYTILILLSGEGADPANDPKMRVGFYLSKEQIAKDASGEVARDYSYRIDPDPRFTTVFDAVSVGGVVRPAGALERMHIRHVGTRANFPPDLTLERPQVRLTMNAKGLLQAEIGGYRDWRYMYMGFGSGGSPNEIAGRLDTPALWYNWKKLADWKAPGTTGPNTHISSFYTMDAVPAFIITPDTNAVVKRAEIFSGASQVAMETLESLAGRMRGAGADPSFRLEGGAAAWPNALDPNAPTAPRRDPVGWAKVLANPAGGMAVIEGKVPLEPATALGAARPGPQAAIP